MNFNNFFKNNLSVVRDKKQKIMIAILIITVIAIIIVVYLGISNSSKFQNPSDSVEKEDKVFLLSRTIDEINFDVKFLDYLEDFEIYGIRPSGEIQKGSTNPFLEN